MINKIKAYRPTKSGDEEFYPAYNKLQKRMFLYNDRQLRSAKNKFMNEIGKTVMNEQKNFVEVPVSVRDSRTRVKPIEIKLEPQDISESSIKEKPFNSQSWTLKSEINSDKENSHRECLLNTQFDLESKWNNWYDENGLDLSYSQSFQISNSKETREIENNLNLKTNDAGLKLELIELPDGETQIQDQQAIDMNLYNSTDIDLKLREDKKDNDSGEVKAPTQSKNPELKTKLKEQISPEQNFKIIQSKYERKTSRLVKNPLNFQGNGLKGNSVSLINYLRKHE